MNCQDIARILDDEDIDRLDEAQRAQAEAHLAGCPGCALERDVQQRIATVPVPPLPPGLAARCGERVAAATLGGGTRRAPRRVVLLGAAVAVAAAAFMLAVRLAPPTAVSAQPVEPVFAASTQAADQPLASSPAAAGEPVLEPPSASHDLQQPEMQHVPERFRVRLMPIDIGNLDAISALILDQLHAALARRLAAVPGVELLSPDLPGPDVGDYVSITIRLAGTRPDGLRAISIDAWMMRDGKQQSALFPSAGVMPGGDIESIARELVDGVRLMASRADPSAQDQLYAQLHDPAADRATRRAALNQLLSPAFGFGPQDTDGRRMVFRAALDLAIAETDPAVRESSWNLLLNTVSAELLEVALDALTMESDDDVRLKLVTILGNGMRFRDDPRRRESLQSSSPALLAAMESLAPAVHAALESVSRTDPRPITRMVAARTVLGEAQWSRQVVSTLNDTSLSDAQRLEPVAFLGGAGPMMSAASMGRLSLDDAAIRTIGELIVREGRDPARARETISALNGLVGLPGTVARDAALGILRPAAGLDPASPVRAAVLVPLMMRHGNDPVVRETIEALAAGDADALMRRRAGQVLQAADQLTEEGMPLLMLQTSQLIEGVVPLR